MKLTPAQAGDVIAVFKAIDNVGEAEALIRDYLAGDIKLGVIEFGGLGLKNLEHRRDQLAMQLIESDDVEERIKLRAVIARLKADITHLKTHIGIEIVTAPASGAA